MSVVFFRKLRPLFTERKSTVLIYFGSNRLGCCLVCGAGELVGLEDTTELSQDDAEDHMDGTDISQDPAAVRFVNLLMELGADKLFKE